MSVRVTAVRGDMVDIELVTWEGPIEVGQRGRYITRQLNGFPRSQLLSRASNSAPWTARRLLGPMTIDSSCKGFADAAKKFTWREPLL